MTDIRPITFHKIIFYLLMGVLGLTLVMTALDVIAWLKGQPQDFMGIILAPIFNPVLIFLDCIIIYLIWRKISQSRKMIRELRWR